MTNRQFAEFVKATGYVSFAEFPPTRGIIPAPCRTCSTPGSLVFQAPARAVDLADWSQWWIYSSGANWRHPYGPAPAVDDLDDHPVVHVTFVDALAYAQWAGMALPTEAEYEYAARNGLVEADYAWGDELAPGGRHMANTWQGTFPHENLRRTVTSVPRRSPRSRRTATAFTTSSAMSGSGRSTGTRPLTRLMRCGRAAHRKIRAVVARMRATTRWNPRVEFPQQGAQRRLAPLCPPNYCRRYPARGTPRAACRHFDEPYRVSVRRAREETLRCD